MNASASPSTPQAIHRISDEASGLDGVIVLHSTKRGPAAGGCRLSRYDDLAAAAHDALRLAEGMAYKNALADLPLGGGKAVLRLPKGRFDRQRLFAAFGREVEKLGGVYVTAEDVGTSVSDMQTVSLHCSYVAGLERKVGKPGGDPSPWTALGVLLSMRVAAQRRYGQSLSGLTIAVQGLGNVGSHLCALLHNEGARLLVADKRGDFAARIASQFGAKLVSPDAIVTVPCDIFAPCALGGVINDRLVPLMRTEIVCGAANNVLASDEDGDRLAERGVLFAPDYVVNAGGIINVAAEYLGWSALEAEQRVLQTGARLGAVLYYAERRGLPSHRAANALARDRMAEDGLQLLPVT
jgi:leucine dehydrogenase